MSPFGNVGLRIKILSVLVIPLSMGFAVATFGWLGFHFTKGIVNRANHYDNMAEQALNIEKTADTLIAWWHGYALTGDEGFLDRYKRGAEAISRHFAELEKSTAKDPPAAKLLNEAKQAFRNWLISVAAPGIRGRQNAGQSENAHDSVSKGKDEEQFNKFRDRMTAFARQQQARVMESQYSFYNTANFTQDAVVVGMILVSFIGLPMAYLVGKAVTKDLFAAVALAKAISEGDLTQRLEPRTTDEVGQLCSSLNDMAEDLSEQTRMTVEGVNTIATTATQISATVTQLGASASRTSAAVTETTTTVEQVKHAAKLSRDKAKKVAEISGHAAQISESGMRATEDTVERMDIIKNEVESIGRTVVQLSEQSQAIEGIISAVQALAGQSNLLAVNASIEAVRAGEQGKGFSVVAQEIKNLADQSKESTEQVRTLLGDIQKRTTAVVAATEQADTAVEAGVEQSVLAGESIQALLQSVSESSQAASLIVTSSEQQFVGFDQVASAMANVDQAMKQNLESTTHIQDAAKRLEELGHSLKQVVERYRV